MIARPGGSDPNGDNDNSFSGGGGYEGEREGRAW
jgi:hypothetical protein